MAILMWIVFGLVVGAIAKLLMPGRDPGGFFVTILIGIAGSFLGGAISWMLFGGSPTDNSLHPAGWILSIIGAIVLLFLYRMITRRRSAL